MELKKSKKRVKHNSATLTFNLETEEGVEGLLLVMKASKMSSFIYEVHNYFRAKQKHAPDEMVDWHRVWDYWCKTTSDFGVDPYE